jgi:hypothetical protein
MGVGSLTGNIGEAMDEPPFSLAFVMVKESLAVPAILFYLAAMLTKTSIRTTFKDIVGVLVSRGGAIFRSEVISVSFIVE